MINCAVKLLATSILLFHLHWKVTNTLVQSRSAQHFALLEDVGTQPVLKIPINSEFSKTCSLYDEGDLISFKTEQEIPNFDAFGMIPYEWQATPDGRFSFMTYIKTSLARPHFFPVSFNIHTRDQTVQDIEFGQHMHKVEVLSFTGKYNPFRFNGQPVLRGYEFDLSKLSSLKSLNLLEKRTMIVIPGYLTGKNAEWVLEVAKKWLKLEDVNVIAVDWSEGNHGLYPTAVSNIRMVSRQIVTLLYYLATLNGVDFNSPEFRGNIYLIGHSLGAHIAGWVGHEMSGEVARITGLDPAGPIFDNLNERDRLNPRNALLVDVIHTNGGTMTAKSSFSTVGTLSCSAASSIKDWITLNKKDTPLTASVLADYYRCDALIYYGIHRRVGHLDYYANGGQMQPGCQDSIRICDHSRAIEIYINALEFEYQARQVLGENANYIKKGKHRLIAFSSPDYDKFKSGAILLKNCPEMLLLDETRQDSIEEKWQSIKNCAIPMDFVKPTKALVEELRSDYGFSLDNSKPDPSSPNRFFFETIAAHPYVSEHFLLKIYIHQQEDSDDTTEATTVEPDEGIESDYIDDLSSTCEGYGIELWDKGCRLRVVVRSYEREDLHSAFNYEPAHLSPIDYDGFHGLALPFANPIDWNAYYPAETKIWLDRVSAFNSLSPGDGGAEIDIDQDVAKNIRIVSINTCRVVNFLPHRISVGLYHTSGVLRRAFDSLSSLISGKKLSRCKINLDRIEVQPFLGLEPYALATYELHKNLDACPVPEILYEEDKDEFFANVPKQCVSLHSEKNTTFLLYSIAIRESRRAASTESKP